MGLNFSKLGTSQAENLERPFLKIEVDKSLGGDAYTMAVWQFNWGIVKKKILLMFKDFFELGKFVRSLNSTLIVLVPKKAGTEELKDFRPISLVNSLYKLI